MGGAGELGGLYTPETLGSILDAAEAALDRKPEEGETAPRPLLPSVPQVTLRWWAESRSPEEHEAPEDGASPPLLHPLSVTLSCSSVTCGLRTDTMSQDYKVWR